MRLSYSSMNSLIFTIFLLCLCATPILSDLQCTDPQKGFFMSYNAISKKDTMQNVFT